MSTNIVHASLCPRVLVYETSEIHGLLQSAINLPDLATLLQPWQRNGVEKVTLRTSTFENIVAPTFPLHIDLASKVYDENTWQLDGWLDSITQQINQTLDVWLKEIPQGRYKTPWYDAFLHSFLNCRPITPIETFNHPVLCLLATSTEHPEPLNALAELYAATSPANLAANRPFMDPNVLRYYVVIHDVKKGNLDDSVALLNQIKRAYGIHCALLTVNSYDPDAPDPLEGEKDVRPAAFDTMWSEFLPENLKNTVVTGMGERDAYAIRVFLREMTVQSLIPWMERNVQQWNEQLTATRKGLTNRLFSASRKYFGGSTSGRASPSGQPLPRYDQVRGFYPSASAEAQTRRLADFAFMIRDYKLATTVYEFLRKDCQNDKAWADFAQASQMLVLSLLLSPHNKRVPIEAYLEQASSVVASSHGVEALLDNGKGICLIYELLKHSQDIDKAPMLLRRAAGDLEEVPSAILLEQAAVADMNSRPAAWRKAAFHLCMAAQRYEKTGIKRLALHCLEQVTIIYESLHRKDVAEDKPVDPPPMQNATWRLIDQHVQQSLGRQAYNLGRSGEAAQHFLALLAKPQGEHVQDPSDIEEDRDVWDDLKNATESGGANLSADIVYPNPIFHPNDASLDITGSDHDTDLCDWQDLEQDLLRSLPTTQGERPQLQHGMPGQVGVNETFHLRLVAKNVLGTKVKLTNISITATTPTGDTVSLEQLSVDCGTIFVDPCAEQTVRLALTCHQETSFSIKSIHYTLNDILSCTDSLAKRGARLHSTRDQLLTPSYAVDTSLNVVARPPIPLLEIDFGALPTKRAFAGEVLTTTMACRNASPIAIGSIFFISSAADALFIQDTQSVEMPAVEPSRLRASSQLRQNSAVEIALNACLESQQEIVSQVVYCPQESGSHTVALLYAYTVQGQPNRFLLSRRILKLDVQPSIDLRLDVQSCDKAGSRFVLNLQVENTSVPEHVVVDAILTFSTNWTNTSSLLKSTVIPFGQVAHFSFPLNMSGDLEDTGEMTWTPNQLEKLLQGQELSKDVPPDALLNLSWPLAPEQCPTALAKLYMASKGSQDPRLPYSLIHQSSGATMRRLTSQFPTIKPALFPHLFRIFTPRSLDIVLFWSLPQTNRTGLVHMADVALGPRTNTVRRVVEQAEAIAGGIYAESQMERATLLASIQSSEFGQTDNPIALCQTIAPILSWSNRLNRHSCTFLLRNTNPFIPCTYTLDLSPPPMEKDSRPSVTWVGQLVFQGHLDRGQQAELEAHFIVPHPGVWDTGRCSLTVTSDNETFQVSGPPSQVVVTLKS